MDLSLLDLMECLRHHSQLYRARRSRLLVAAKTVVLSGVEIFGVYPCLSRKTDECILDTIIESRLWLLRESLQHQRRNNDEKEERSFHNYTPRASAPQMYLCNCRFIR